MKVFLTLVLLGLFSSTNAFAALSVEERVVDMFADAQQRPVSELAFKKIMMMNVLETIASSDIKNTNPDLVEKVKVEIAGLNPAFSAAQRRIVERALTKLDK